MPDDNGATASASYCPSGTQCIADWWARASSGVENQEVGALTGEVVSHRESRLAGADDDDVEDL